MLPVTSASLSERAYHGTPLMQEKAHLYRSPGRGVKFNAAKIASAAPTRTIVTAQRRRESRFTFVHLEQDPMREFNCYNPARENNKSAVGLPDPYRSDRSQGIRLIYEG
jgi:hypothetical protein